MGILEIVVISLLVILFFTIGRIPSIIQLLGSILTNIRRSILNDLIEDNQIEKKDEPKK